MSRGCWCIAVSMCALLCACGGSDNAAAGDSCPAPAAASTTPLAPGARLSLADGWAIRTSDGLDAGGAKLSTTCYARGNDWNAAHVPSTVVAALVDDGVYKDPDFGMNLRDAPGTDYGIGLNFSNFPMSDSSPFKPAWWYRTDFELPPAGDGERTLIHFDGINYKANIWLNGKLIADDTKIAGMYRRYELDVTGVAKPGKHNVLAVQVTAPGTNELADTFIDWMPMPPDKHMGIWHDVYVTTSGAVTVRHPMVTSKLAMPALDSAALTVEADVANHTGKAVSGKLTAKIGAISVSEDVSLAANETKAVKLTPAAHPELVIASPKVWWPYQLGTPDLYDLQLDFAVGGKTSDSVSSKFGVREITAEMTKDQHVLFSVNGKRILIRGGGYTSNMMLKFDDDRDEKEMHLVKDMGLNAIRLEGKLANEHLLDVTDREGILVIAGWECCNIWEKFFLWDDTTKAVAKASIEDQIHRLRGRASILTWWNGSDHHPSAEVEQMYIDAEKAEDWPNPVQPSADEVPSTVSGPTGVKMTGPYDYVPPIYWYVDTKNGGAFGFNTETSPGPAVPDVESLKRFLPADHLWPIDKVWDYHAGGPPFDKLDNFTAAMDARYGKAKDIGDYALKSQVLTYDGERAMFEAFRRNKYTSTGVVQWMLNDGWPSLIWHLYDFYYSAGGGYYGAKKANELVHIQYSYDDQTVVVVNDKHEAFTGMKASVSVYDFALKQTFTQEKTLDVPEDSSNIVLTIPDQTGITTTWFVKLSLSDGAGKLVSDNFYWLSTKADKLDWPNTTFQSTPSLEHGDLTMLAGLSPVALDVTATNGGSGASRTTTVKVTNPSTSLAFMVRLRMSKGAGGEEVLPSTFSDNDFALMPGEQRDVVASFADDALAGSTPVVEVGGWNVTPATITPQ